MRSTVGKRWIFGLALAALAQTAYADVPLPLDRFNLAVGGFYPVVDARISAGGPSFAGTDVNFEKDLGLDKHRTLPSLHLDLLVFDSQGFSIGGYQYSKTARATLSRDIEFDGNNYDVNAFVEAGLRLFTYNAAWHWWLAAGDNDVIGLGLGGVYYKIKGTIEGGITISGGSASARGQAEASAVAPLLTLAWRHAFSDSLRTYLDFSGVRKNSGALTGHLVNGTLGFEWYVFHNLGLSLEYSSNALSLKAKRDEWQGRASIDFRGPAAYLRTRF